MDDDDLGLNDAFGSVGVSGGMGGMGGGMIGGGMMGGGMMGGGMATLAPPTAGDDFFGSCGMVSAPSMPT